MSFPKGLCRCYALFISASILFLRSKISCSLLCPPSAYRASAQNLHRVTSTANHLTQRSFSMYSMDPNLYAGNDYNSMPPHELHEEDDLYAFQPRKFDRQNYSRKKELSERNKHKLKALSSSGFGDDEWDEYAAMSNNDASVTYGSDEKDTTLELRMIDEGPERFGVVGSSMRQSEDLILNETDSKNNQSVRSSLKPLEALSDEVSVDTVGDEISEFQGNRIKPAVDVTSSAVHNRGTSSNDDVSVSKFRKTFQSKSVFHPNSGNQKIPPQSRISNEKIEEIKSSISIVDAIESYNLPSFVRTNAHSAKACCPFHDDNNPSMSIDDNRRLYKCFACGAGGDLFNFIREYDALDGRREKMGFMKAVQYAVREFGDNHLAYIGDFETPSKARGSNISETSKAKIIERENKKDRIREANSAAAAFYIKCLVTLPTAGKARSHLRSRKLSPESIRTFALGYAPDCYYGDESSEESVAAKKKWGQGSLVEYLSTMGFLPNEIVDAGLAVRTNKKTSKQDDDGSDDYSDLIDRFRNRVMVPILDSCGRHVLGFGGRHLDSSGATDSKYTPAKYINSPESAVFKKKVVLFNEHNAQISTDESSMDITTGSKDLTDTRHLPVIIVEGYFDAISLANVGLNNVVASMGTALTVEQMKNAAAMVDSRQMVLCMDNDNAGRNAVERICSSNMIIKTPELSGTEILVATLPEGIKDPSDFVASKESDAKSQFESEVIQLAEPWDLWYIRQITQKYDESKDGTSFAAICEEVANFLAMFPNAADRTRRVHSIVDILLDLISKDSDSKSSLGMMRVQLEADMINIVSRKAVARESIERRMEERDGLGKEVGSKLDIMTRGGEAESDDFQRLSTSALAKLHPPTRRSSSSVNQSTIRRTSQQKSTDRTTYKSNKVRPRQRDLMPHFNGFTFTHKSDRDWLGLSSNPKPKMYLGSTGFDKKPRSNEPVYFNSNQYLGERYLTQKAMEAGYLLSDNDNPTVGESLTEFTDRMLLERDANQMIEQAENRLLHALTKFTQARAIMRSVYVASTFLPPNMKWTSEERQWLFECLTGTSKPALPTELLENGTSNQLRSVIVSRSDCPPSAFIPDSTNSSTVNDATYDATFGDNLNGTNQSRQTSNGIGSLEIYFMDASHMFPSFRKSKIAEETRAELTVQETVATLVRATAIKRFSTVKRRLAKIVLEIDKRADSSGDTEKNFDKDFSTTSSEELQDLFESVALEVMEAQQSLYEADRSTDRVNAHLLDYSTENSVQYRTSQAEVERLEKMMEDHIASLPDDTHRPDVPGDDDSYIFGLDEASEEIDARFGGRRASG